MNSRVGDEQNHAMLLKRRHMCGQRSGNQCTVPKPYLFRKIVQHSFAIAGKAMDLKQRGRLIMGLWGHVVLDLGVQNTRAGTFSWESLIRATHQRGKWVKGAELACSRQPITRQFTRRGQPLEVRSVLRNVLHTDSIRMDMTCTE